MNYKMIPFAVALNRFKYLDFCLIKCAQSRDINIYVKDISYQFMTR